MAGRNCSCIDDAFPLCPKNVRCVKNCFCEGAGSELRPAAEADGLQLVALRAAGDVGVAILLHERVRVVEPQRTEWRVPQDAGTDRGANLHVVARRRNRLALEQLLQLRLGRSLIVPHRPCVGEHRQPHAEILRHAGDRELKLGRRAPVFRAAEGIEIGAVGPGRAARCRRLQSRAPGSDP
jgi:hypothetical protein